MCSSCCRNTASTSSPCLRCIIPKSGIRIAAVLSSKPGVGQSRQGSCLDLVNPNHGLLGLLGRKVWRLFRWQARPIRRYAFATRLNFLTLFGNEFQELKTVTVPQAISDHRAQFQWACRQIKFQFNLLSRLKFPAQISGNSTFTDFHSYSLRTDDPIWTFRVRSD